MTGSDSERMSEVRDYLNFTQYRRVLSYAQWPTKEEVFEITKISAAGIFLIGALGFIIFTIMSFLPG